jgi:hypothetical protein
VLGAQCAAVAAICNRLRQGPTKGQIPTLVTVRDPDNQSQPPLCLSSSDYRNLELQRSIKPLPESQGQHLHLSAANFLGRIQVGFMKLQYLVERFSESQYFQTYSFPISGRSQQRAPTLITLPTHWHLYTCVHA